jgi:sulfatase modifying factor 1
MRKGEFLFKATTIRYGLEILELKNYSRRAERLFFLFMKLISRLYIVLVAIFGINCSPVLQEKEGMVKVNDAFYMDVSPVTVSQFRAFIDSTAYITEAESFGDGGVFDFKTGQWTLVKGANWKHPFGPEEPPAEDNHPVTQVSWNDAQAYARWAGKRLPTSEEFVLAEKNGKENYDKVYTWGDDFKVNDIYKANFWQGIFPVENTQDDGFLATSPVGYFGKNRIGLTDMGGNVWQWCSDPSSSKPGEMNQRGGSFLCDPSVCHGFKIGGKSSSSPETSLVHVGFRCVKDVN